MRLIAVQYTEEVFPQDNVATRYTLHIGAGDLKDDVAKRKDELLSGPILPDFIKVLIQVSSQQHQVTLIAETNCCSVCRGGVPP